MIRTKLNQKSNKKKINLYNFYQIKYKKNKKKNKEKINKQHLKLNNKMIPNKKNILCKSKKNIFKKKMDGAAVLAMMKELNQTEIVSRMEAANDKDKEYLVKQVNHLERVWPGGIKGYIDRAKVLLEDSKNGKNPLEEYTPSVPEGFNVKVGDPSFYELEKLGFEEIKNTCFVLVAGGLGERLGYNDIKIGIQSNMVTLDRFIQVYINYILAYEAKFKKEENIDEDWYIPLAIMTSGDTHDKTVKLLNNNYNFGMKPFQITIVKQEKCPAILDNDCHLAMKKDVLEIETKPHGHGDIHTLLYQNGLVHKLVEDDKNGSFYSKILML